MELTLDGISKTVGAQPWLYDMSLAPRSGAVTVLLGATQAGKTTLMRIMAGLDRPSEELRDELAQLFAAGDSTVIYATTEPAEALLLGGYTAVPSCAGFRRAS